MDGFGAGLGLVCGGGHGGGFGLVWWCLFWFFVREGACGLMLGLGRLLIVLSLQSDVQPRVIACRSAGLPGTVR